MGFFSDVVWVVSSITKTIRGVSYPILSIQPSLNDFERIQCILRFCPFNGFNDFHVVGEKNVVILTACLAKGS